MQQTLNNDTQKNLRDAKLITELEVVYSIGDKYVAENILTKVRREIAIPANLVENTSNRRVLKG